MMNDFIRHYTIVVTLLSFGFRPLPNFYYKNIKFRSGKGEKEKRKTKRYYIML